MTDFAPIRRLEVWRRWSTGSRTLVGVLAQNRQGVFFQYDRGYLSRYPSLSPTAFLGHGSNPPLDAMQQIAAQANFANWAQAREVIDRVADAIGRWTRLPPTSGSRGKPDAW